MRLWVPAGVIFVIAGVLEVMFLCLSVLGTMMGGVMTVATLAGELRNEEALMGPLLLLFYAFWLLATLIAGPLHIVAGISMISGGRRRKLVWAATVCSVLPLATMYCAPTALLAGVFGLVTLLSAPPEDALPS